MHYMMYAYIYVYIIVYIYLHIRILNTCVCMPWSSHALTYMFWVGCDQDLSPTCSTSHALATRNAMAMWAAIRSVFQKNFGSS